MVHEDDGQVVLVGEALDLAEIAAIDGVGVVCGAHVTDLLKRVDDYERGVRPALEVLLELDEQAMAQGFGHRGELKVVVRLVDQGEQAALDALVPVFQRQVEHGAFARLMVEEGKSEADA